MRTLVNWEGRLCFGFDFSLLYQIISSPCSLDFGYVKLTPWSQGKALSPDLLQEHVVQMLHLYTKCTVKMVILVYWFVQVMKF